jgi:hypothetical protein
VVTATTFSGNLTGTASTASFATTSFGLSGNPSISVTGINASGITTVSAGSTAAPSISPSGDSNTGIFFPSADTINASTGGTSRIIIDSNGNITLTNNFYVPLGSAAAPSISFTGDTNTGIYSPGADTLAISTNSTGRLTIDSSGNINIDSGTVYVDAVNNRLGIGITSPSFTLDVTGTHRNSGIYFNQNDTPQTTAGTISRHSVVGMVTRGITSSVFDWSVYSASGTALIVNTTGTNNIAFPGGNVLVTGGNLGIGITNPSVGFEAALQAYFSALEPIYGGFGARSTGGVEDWNHVTNARSGGGWSLLLGTSANGPGQGAYFHPFSFEYAYKNGGGNMTQFAIGYNTSAVYFRWRYSNVWSSWTQL